MAQDKFCVAVMRSLRDSKIQPRTRATVMDRVTCVDGRNDVRAYVGWVVGDLAGYTGSGSREGACRAWTEVASGAVGGECN